MFNIRWLQIAFAVLILAHFSIPAYSADADGSSIFISGFTAYQNQDYKTAAEKMSQFLDKYPDTTLRDVATFWLARAYFKLGNRQEAARYMARFLHENPNSPLKNAVEDELLALAKSYEKGEPLPPAVMSAPKPVIVAEKPSEQKPATGEQAAVSRKEEKTSGQETAAHNLMREKAVAGYRSVVEKFPGTKAASVAAQRLKDLGEKIPVVSMGPVTVAAATSQGKNAQVVQLEVEQSAAAEFDILPYGVKHEVGKMVSIPFDVVNRGNGTDRFLLETAFPPDFKARFVTADSRKAVIGETPSLTPGESFNGIVEFTIPNSTVDGQKSTYPVKLISKFDSTVSLSREISVVTQAPLLRMVLNPDKSTVTPGETVTYRIDLLNIGSSIAGNVSFSLAYPPQYEPVEPLPAGFRKQSKSMLVTDSLGVGSGENKVFNVQFRLKEDALAGQELFCRAELNNMELQTRDTFLSPAAVVGRVSGVSARTANPERIVIPGQRIIIPITVTNTGNMREKVVLKPSIPSGFKYRFFRDSGNGETRQSEESLDGSVGPLSPREEALLKLEITTPASATDNSDATLSVVFEPEADREKSSSLNFRLLFSRPVVELETRGKGGKLKPGEISHLEISIVNRGSNMAKDVELESLLPKRIEVVASDPASTTGAKGELLWRFADLGPGERRTITLAYKIRQNVAAGTSLSIENLVRYSDQNGNKY